MLYRIFLLSLLCCGTFSNSSPCTHSYCKCSTCSCAGSATHTALLRAFADKKVYFYGDSVTRNAAFSLGKQLENIDNYAQDPEGYTDNPWRYECPLDCRPMSVDSQMDWYLREEYKADFSASDPTLKLLTNGPAWQNYAQSRGEVQQFHFEWDDNFAYVPRTNTSISIFFCFTPQVLARKLALMWNFTYGPWPDVIMFNVGRWSTKGPSFGPTATAAVRRMGFPGTITIPEYSLARLTHDIMDVVRDLDRRLQQLHGRGPVVAYREQTWIDPSGKNNTQFALNEATREEWLRHRPLHVRYVPLFAFSAYKCCEYRDYSHPGEDCNIFLNTWTAAHVIFRAAKS